MLNLRSYYCFGGIINLKKLKTSVMKKNMSNTDRIVRVILAAIFAALYFSGTLPGTLGLILTVLGGVFLLTSLISWCPIYAVFGISTCAIPKSAK